MISRIVNRAFAVTPKVAEKYTQKNGFGPKLDENNEPRFLEQVKLFYQDAAAATGISEEYLNLIKAC